MPDSTTAPPADERGPRRRALENASVYFLSGKARPSPEELPREWLPKRAADALEDLATSRTPRVVKLQHLIHLLLSDERFRDTDAFDKSIRLVLEHTLPTDKGDLPPQARVDRAKGYLDAALRDEGGRRFREGHWNRFVADAGELFGFDLPERTFQGRGRCNDEETAPKLTPEGERVDSSVITAEFQSDQPPSAFIDYVDPRFWPICSSFWQEMTQLTTPTRAPNGGYDGVFNEVVEVGRQTLRVPLEVGFRVSTDLSRVWVRFNIDRAEYFRRKDDNDPVPVDVDTGTVSAESVPGEAGPRTLVRATKYLHAVDGGAARLFPRLACDVGWPELMIAMAFRCSPDGPPPAGAAPVAGATAAAGAGPAAGAGDLADVAVRRFVREAVNECLQGVEHTGSAVQQLMGRFTGPTWDAGWINDLLDIGAETTRRYSRVAGHLRGLADDLSKAADQRRGS